VKPTRRSASYQPPIPLAEEEVPPDAPLAARMRPRSLDEVVGQEAAIGPGSAVRRALAAGYLPSLILWGPPGCGKTTIARLLAREVAARFVQVSAVASGVGELRAIIEEARRARSVGVRTVLFIDEIHRFNKAQQDVVLPAVEDGGLVLIGATTENPSFEVVAPLLSRMRVLRLEPLSPEALGALIDRALTDPGRGLGAFGLTLDREARQVLIAGAGGDARVALTALELAAYAARGSGRSGITAEDVKAALLDRRPGYDKAGDAHYDTISAFIKSLRGSDPDAALYWLARMLEAGEDPLFIVRRMVIFAAEDVGLADPQALVIATACQQAVHFVGMPEGFLPLAETALYLALAPKSNSALRSYARAREAARTTAHLPVPLHLRNAVTGLMRAMGYGQGYRYPHDEPRHVAAGERYLPEELGAQRFYEPGTLGREPELGSWRPASSAEGFGEEATP
jgi:putative ATPase